ncbi:inosine-uridine preferring nucleoside hydrolase-like [Fopius arisanus]|uniref:Inosine-uridine preferring nucleoside hydrolase-like n=1 Tax=Fopius arisanus TaxID=64838 RepID=A0A9R1UBS4_9HYME|nr:PREDICTED: inosine-uridine preferring nucleoside hydrolase-like [Fopius arisanus]XP_011314807.1 PREDICTED: inosine-uridine preferring nucleoside hydrolase-like [Fopius arisanus]XP_011314808.1 PREDICTED: inosine-uridine preferring nucleoside hydrolase-like [Fopius arisanus]
MKKVIVDCDAGYDDAIALIMLIAAHKRKQLEIKAVTCVNGNTKLDNVVKNVFRILKTCNALDIPVYKGARSALVVVESSKKAEEILYHGDDGFGDVFSDDVDISKLQSDHAVIGLHEIITKNPNEISLVCLGPLTNIALAMKVYPEILDIIKDFYVMGGNSTAVGNASAQAEFNFYADCESVHIVLGSNIKPLWLLPWESCTKSTITHEWRDNILGKESSEPVEMLNKIEGGIYSRRVKKSTYRPCDAFLAACLINPELITKQTDYHADIELAGTKTRGQVVLDHLQNNKPNVHLIEELDFQKYEELMYSSFTFSF